MDAAVDAPGTTTNLLNLPNEILLSIVDFYVESSDPPDLQVRQSNLTRLSHVCQKLRAVIVGCPKYWNTICSGLRKEEIMQTYITRSAGMDVNIIILEKHGQDACETLMKLASRVSNRWRSFSLVLSNTWDLQYALARSFSRLDCYLLYLQLPRLRNLRIHYGTPPLSFTPDFFTTWSYPGLRSMDLLNISPKVAPMSLTSFSMTFCNGRDVSVPLLQYFLESSPSIEKLSLTFEADTSFRVARERAAVVANVQSLRLKVEDSLLESIRPVLRAFTFPKLEDLSIIAKFHQRGQPAVPMMEINDWKSNILGACSSFYDVSSFSLNLCNHSSALEGALSPLSARFTRLKHYSLETNLVVMIAGAEGEAATAEWPLTPLETICFTECETLDIAWLRELKALLTGKEHWEGLRKLRIEQCDKLSRDEVVDVIPEDKLEWAGTRSTPREVFNETYANRRAVFEQINDADFDDGDGDYMDDNHSWGLWSEYSGTDDDYMEDQYIEPEDIEDGDDGSIADEEPYMPIPGAFVHYEPEGIEEDEDQQEIHGHWEYAPDFEGEQDHENYELGVATDEEPNGEDDDDGYAYNYQVDAYYEEDDAEEHHNHNPYLVFDHDAVDEEQEELAQGEAADSEHGYEEHHDHGTGNDTDEPYEQAYHEPEYLSQDEYGGDPHEEQGEGHEGHEEGPYDEGVYDDDHGGDAGSYDGNYSPDYSDGGGYSDQDDGFSDDGYESY
ncbi:hypothetical protein SCHPADRAFT_907546 [Schizopora paradoxa]|uniref:Uncharacterized protein n=1 Tax=Schizopora paradoxa TaxID=27342 RepID=A0A0H2RCY6_9AGAM|nr:hypothetical protein SCHPADRAFT_907546 [Schizopora paradoxa]